MPTHGDSNQEMKYDFLDSRAHSGKNYYRLSQTDLDGTLTELDKLEVTLQFSLPGFVVYPNPSARRTMNLTGLNQGTNYKVKISNASSGSIMYNITSSSSGRAEIYVDKLSNGICFISITDGIKTEVSKFIRLR